METETPPTSEASLGDKEAVEKLHAVYERMKQELSQVIVGQSEVVEQVLMAISCRGHALLVGPGGGERSFGGEGLSDGAGKGSGDQGAQQCS